MRKLSPAQEQVSSTRNLGPRILLIAMLAVLFSPLAALAQCTSTWQGGGSGNWNVAGNWNGGIPTSTSNTCINTASSTVTLNTAGATSTLTLGSSTDALAIANAESLTVSGATISNAGSITMNSSGATTELVIGASNVTLSGAGTLTMSNSLGNFIFGAAGTDVLSNQSTIQGSGSIGHGQMGLNNSGTIDANQTTTLTLQITSSATAINTGTIEATNGATLEILGGTYTNTGGTILNNASTLLLDGNVIINGGTLSQVGAGHIELSNGTINTALTNTSTGIIESMGGNNTIGGALTNVAGGQVKIDNATALTLGTGSSVANAGSITLNSGGATTELIIGASNVTLSGTGTLTMSNSLGNFIFGAAGTDVLTNQSTIQGSGSIGHGQMGLNNSGTIDANQTTTLTLQITSSSTATNTGTIEATNGATLEILGGTYTNTGGTILNNASTLLLDGNVIINGGTLSQVGAGHIELSNGTINTALTNTSTGIIETTGGNNTIGGTLTNVAGGQVKIDNATALTLGAGSSVVNAGSITLNSSGATTELIIGASNVTLSGAGTVTMSNSTGNFIFGATGTDVLTNQTTIQGAGHIGNGQLTLSNAGTIDANQATNMLTLQVTGSSTATNTGTLEASAGATLFVVGGTYSQTGAGKFLATGANSEVLLDDATIVGGTLTGASGGKFVAENDTTLNGVTINTGTMFNVGNGQLLNFSAGTITNKGTINLTSTGSTTEIVINGAVTLASTGKLILSNSADNFILGTGTLTNQNTIQGAGNIGNGQIAVINSGTISAVDSTTLFINTDSSGFTNNVGTKQGTLSVSAHDTLTIEGGPFNNFSGTTLTGGIYKVSGTLGFAGANIVTNAASITLTGTTAEILNTTSSTNGLMNLATNASGSTFGLAGGAKFTTVGNFTNNGTLNVGAGDKFSIGANGASNLTNYNSGTSTLTGGIYILTGTGQIQFNNGGNANDIVTNAANITLSSTSTLSSFIDQTGANALANFATNASNGSFTLSADRSFTTGGNLTNAGIMNIQKSTGTGSTALIVGGTGVYSQTGGTTTVDGVLNASGGINVSGGFLYGNAAGITGGKQGTLVGNLNLTGGTLNPGDGLKKIGDLNITGTFAESGAGILNIDLDGIVANTKYDVLNVSGAAALGGTINIDLLTGFTPIVGDTWDVLNYASETGSFTTVNLPTAPTGDHYVFACGATDCTLTLDSGAAAASSATAAVAAGTVSASPARRVSRSLGAVASASNTHEPLAILSLATCSAARMLVSISCGERSAGTLSHGNELHAVASAGSGLGAVHNNVMPASSRSALGSVHNNVMPATTSPSLGAAHNNVMVATRSISSARGGASNEPSASASAMARLYVCAYLPSSMARTMGCSN